MAGARPLDVGITGASREAGDDGGRQGMGLRLGQKPKRLLIVLDPAAFDRQAVEDMVPLFKDFEATLVYSGKPTADIKIFSLDAIPEATVDGLLEGLRAAVTEPRHIVE